MMKYFTVVFILLSAIGVNAQNFTNADVTGTYYLIKLVENDSVIYDVSSEKACMEFFIKQFAADPSMKGIVIDSTTMQGVVRDAIKGATFQKLYFDKNNKVIMQMGVEPADTMPGVWKLNLKTNKLYTTADGEELEIPMAKVNGKIELTILIKGNRMVIRKLE